MTRITVLSLSMLLMAGAGRPPAPRPAGVITGTRDTVQAGDRVIDPARLRPFALERRLTLTPG